MKILTDTCNSVREVLSKVESYLTMNRGSLSRKDIYELENCIKILRKMEKEHCDNPSKDYLKMALQVVEFLLVDVNRTLYGQEAEIAVSSPLYIPLIFEPFQGIFELFGEVSKHVGAEFYFSHTGLADSVVEEAAKNTKAKLTEINSRKFSLHLVRSDTKIQSIITDDEKLEKLVRLGLIIKGKGEEEHFEHMIRVSRFSY